MRILRAYTSDRRDDLDEWDFSNEIDSVALQRLIDSQAIIGWDNVFKGRISIEWRHIQSAHLQSTEDPNNPRPAYRTATYWASCLVQQIVYFTLNTWQIRNDKLHEDKLESEQKAKRKSVITAMSRWYEEASTSRPEFRDHNLFKMPFLQRKSHTTPMIESWIATVKEQYDYIERKRTEAEHEQRTQQARRDRIYAMAGQRRPPRGRVASIGGGRGRAGGRGRR